MFPERVHPSDIALGFRSTRTSDRAVAALFEQVIQGHRAGDQRQVAECLREVAHLLAPRVDFLPIQPDMICIRQHLLKRGPRAIQATGHQVVLDRVNFANHIGSFAAAKPVIGVINSEASSIDGP